MKKDNYPDEKISKYIDKEFQKRKISLEDIAYQAWKHQNKFKKITFNEAKIAVHKVLIKREVRNAIMLALAIDNLASKNKLPEPLQSIICKDEKFFGVDEMLAINGIAQLYGSIAVTNFGYLDVQKNDIAKKLDTNQKNGGDISTMMDDCISAIQACTEAYLAHKMT